MDTKNGFKSKAFVQRNEIKEITEADYCLNTVDKLVLNGVYLRHKEMRHQDLFKNNESKIGLGNRELNRLDPEKRSIETEMEDYNISDYFV